MKNYTDLEQSQILSKILPLETADAIYPWRELIKDYDSVYVPKDMSDIGEEDIPCWSLTALLSVLPEKYTELIKEGGMYRIMIKDSYMTSLFYNPIDACCVMIIKLHEILDDYRHCR